MRTLALENEHREVSIGRDKVSLYIFDKSSKVAPPCPELEQFINGFPTLKILSLKCFRLGLKNYLRFLPHEGHNIRDLTIGAGVISPKEFSMISKIPLIEELDVRTDGSYTEIQSDFGNLYIPHLKKLRIKTGYRGWNTTVADCIIRHINSGHLEELVLETDISVDDAHRIGSAILNSPLTFKCFEVDEYAGEGITVILEYFIKRAIPISLRIPDSQIETVIKMIKLELLTEIDIESYHDSDEIDPSVLESLSKAIVNSKTLESVNLFEPLCFMLPKPSATPSKLRSMRFDVIDIPLKEVCKAYPNLEYLFIETLVMYDDNIHGPDMHDIFRNLNADCRLEGVTIEYVCSSYPYYLEKDIRLIEDSYKRATLRGWMPENGVGLSSWKTDFEIEDGDDEVYIDESLRDYDSWNQFNGRYLGEYPTKIVERMTPVVRRNHFMRERARDAATTFMTLFQRYRPYGTPRDIYKMLSKYIYDTHSDIEAWDNID